MNKYIGFYDQSLLKDIAFKQLSKKALAYGVSAVAIGWISVLFYSFGNFREYSASYVFISLGISAIIMCLCFMSANKLKKLDAAKKNILGNLNEIENKLFVENSVLRNETLVGITKENQLFIMGRNSFGNFFTYLATNKYLHYSPVNLDQQQIIYFEKLLKGDKEFYKVKESL